MTSSSAMPSDGAQEQSRMIEFLKDTLKELEEAQGAPDEEAQQALRTLQERMTALEQAQRSASASDNMPCQPDEPGPSDIEIASKIDRLDEQLKTLESKLGEADGQVHQLLGHSTALWLKEHQQSQSNGKSQGPDASEHDDDPDGPIQRRR